MFELIATDSSSKARRGRLTTAHGLIETPAFIPVGTQGTVKAVSPRELRELNAQIILGNTYHLFVRPGLDVIRHFGGLHSFMNWDGPILTDSGGYQIFSLAKLRKITEEGVHFQNHVDGALAFISPEIAMEIQATLGSDIAMMLDECAPYPSDYEYAARSAEMTTRWARRCKQWTEENAERPTRNIQHRTTESEQSAIRNPQSAIERQLLFGIVQGATFDDLRKESAQAIVDHDFDGYAIGGVRMDMFDCVLPTRLARNGTAFTTTGTLNLKNADFARDKSPIEENCACPACLGFTRGYIRHLIKAEEILGLRLITLHNLHFYLDLMRQAREQIQNGSFGAFRKRFVSNYKTRDLDLAERIQPRINTDFHRFRRTTLG